MRNAHAKIATYFAAVGIMCLSLSAFAETRSIVITPGGNTNQTAGNGVVRHYEPAGKSTQDRGMMICRVWLDDFRIGGKDIADWGKAQSIRSSESFGYDKNEVADVANKCIASASKKMKNRGK